MYEQSSGNTVAYNSVTHGGDGLFLWAGQSTMDTGQGGANDNLFYGNDFSHAVANGIEATFSRNRFVSNRIDDCWHGVWGGYSYDTKFLWQYVRAAMTKPSPSSTARTSRIAGNTFSEMRRRSACGQNADAGSELGLSEEPRYAQPRLRRSNRTRSPVTRPRST